MGRMASFGRRKLNLESLKGCLPEFTPDAWEKLQRYAELLADVALPRGLIGFEPVRIPEQIVRSLAFLQVIGTPSSVIDVGSGAGLPGVPLAIALGDSGATGRSPTTAVLVEPKVRAVSFLERVVRELDLEVDVMAESAEEAGRSALRESGDAVVYPGRAPHGVIAELFAPQAAGGCVVVVPAAPSPGLAAPSHSAQGLDQLGLEAPQAVLLSPIREIEQRVHIMRKIGPTSPRFPRRPGVARRRPLW
jgi:16S rRNA G527 N7-methylase RsmG